MEVFLNDVVTHLQKYYLAVVDITPKILLGVLILVIAWIIASKLQQFSNVRLKRQMRDPLLANFISRLFKAIFIVIGLLFVFRIVGLSGIAQTLLAGAGISAFVVGFALKDIGENFLAGILLAFKRPFAIGEIIESNGVKGKVMALNLRDTQIKSNGKDIYIPNALLIKNTLINFNSGGFLLQDFMIGLEYGADYDKAINVIENTLDEVEEVVNEDKLSNSAVISNIAGTTIQITVRYWVRTDAEMTNGLTRSKVIMKVMEALKNAEIVIK